MALKKYGNQTDDLNDQRNAERSNIKKIGFDLIKRISSRLYSKTGVDPKQIQASPASSPFPISACPFIAKKVIELHDCFAPNELITYEALGLCPVGGSCTLVFQCELKDFRGSRRPGGPRGQHLRRQMGDQPQRRADQQGTPDRGDRWVGGWQGGWVWWLDS